MERENWLVSVKDVAGKRAVSSVPRNVTGLEQVAEQELQFDATPPAGSRFWQANVEMSFAADLADLTPERRAALDSRVEDAFAAFLDGDRYRVKAHVRIATGVRRA